MNLIVFNFRQKSFKSHFNSRQTNPGFTLTRPKWMSKPRSRRTGFKKSLSPIETLPEQMINLLVSAWSFMISNMDEYLLTNLQLWKSIRENATSKKQSKNIIYYVSLDVNVVTLWKLCCCSRACNIVVFES